jgi:hypothetical protein
MKCFMCKNESTKSYPLSSVEDGPVFLCDSHYELMVKANTNSVARQIMLDTVQKVLSES